MTSSSSAGAVLETKRAEDGEVTAAGTDANEVRLRQHLFEMSDVVRRFRLRRKISTQAARSGLRDGGIQRGDRPTLVAGVEVDAPFDTGWADPDPDFAQVVHVFHLEWHGIRAAAGYSSGRKVGFTANRRLTAHELRKVVHHCVSGDVRAVVFHALSDNMVEVIRTVRHVAGKGIRTVLVWHGSTAQFFLPVERDGFATALELRRRCDVDVLMCVKPEMELLNPSIHPETLINLPPTLNACGPVHSRATGNVLVPMPDDWWKNPSTNVIAAARTPGVTRVYTTAPLEQPKSYGLKVPVESLGRLSRDRLFRVLGRVDAVLNVSLADCQPMTSLEALAHGVPCLTGPIGLGDLDLHPYQQMVQVAGTASLRSISSALHEVLRLNSSAGSELRGMLDEYRAQLIRLAKQRLGGVLFS